MISFRAFLAEARFETEIHKNPHPDTIKAIAKKHGSARFVIDIEDNMHVGSAHHFVHPDLGSDEDHIASGAVHHDRGAFSYWAHAPEHNDKVEHAHLKRLEKHGIKHIATDTQFNEAFSNWRKAYGAHNKEEQRDGNKMWKYRWPIAATVGAAAAHSFATGDHAMGAFNVFNGMQLASKHVARIREIKKKYDEADKREAEHKEWKLARAKYEQDEAARKLMAKQKKRKKT